MSTKEVSPPAGMAVSLDDIAATLRMGTDEVTELGTYLTLAVRAATQEAEHQTGRAFITRPMLVTLDSFPCTGAIRLDMSPVFSVEAVKFRDADGNVQQLDPQDYEIDDASTPGWIVPAQGKAWPTTAARISSVTVEYTAGYGADDTTVPECARNYILMRLADQFDPVTAKFASSDVDRNRMLDSLRVY